MRAAVGSEQSSARADGDPRGDALARALRGYLAHLRVERGLSPNTLAAYERGVGLYRRVLRGHLSAGAPS